MIGVWFSCFLEYNCYLILIVEIISSMLLKPFLLPEIKLYVVSYVFVKGLKKTAFLLTHRQKTPKSRETR